VATTGARLEQTLSSCNFESPSCQHDDGLSAFTTVRPRLFGIAYRMLGSAADAEDIVQDVWVSWQRANRTGIENATAFLATATTRLCINVSHSARSRRETYSESWHPEPVDARSDPGWGAEIGESLRLAVLRLLEKLTPRERAAYILREAFDYSYRQIGDILQTEEANSRQLVSRARKRIDRGRCSPVSSREHRRLLEAFVAAAKNGDLAPLKALFREEAASGSDGSGILPAHWTEFLPTNVS